ncbi:hypothetical protein WR25_04144 [Diploscapter pachys]|uniref:Rad21/Rec8-like protein C-terminal eukaryotic domain-containing protein n=1 Tax=Diploscapter pachys TaxID=2018661 RepID=A0A2A2JVB2_9BILA|nr:hypothetical protein WR25_04144 [Diploscapter pachys]
MSKLKKSNRAEELQLEEEQLQEPAIAHENTLNDINMEAEDLDQFGQQDVYGGHPEDIPLAPQGDDEFMADIENQPPFGDLELDDPFSRPQISEEDKDEEEDEISEEAKRAKWAERCNELFEDIKLEKVVKAADEEEKVKFSHIVSPVRCKTAKEAAQKFISLLILAQMKAVCVDQSEPYGEIQINPLVERLSEQEAT